MYRKSALIGYTGFVGSNLLEQTTFNECYNSKNIGEIAGQEFDLVVCAGVSAIKWFANQNPEIDLSNIADLKHNISKAVIKHLVLISTVDVYDMPVMVDEDHVPDVNKQDFYGKHRYELEQWVMHQPNISSYTIVRLPGLFGKYLKKNLIFDIMNPLASSINKTTWIELQTRMSKGDILLVQLNYIEDELGNLQVRPNLNAELKLQLVEVLENVGFTTLNFTDSRSSFQFYNLASLWHDISQAMTQHIPLINVAVEPITAEELVENIKMRKFVNHTLKGSVNYNVYSKYAPGKKYFLSKEQSMIEIQQFIKSNKS